MTGFTKKIIAALSGKDLGGGDAAPMFVLLTAVLLSLTYELIAMVDPFGLDEALDRQSLNVIDRVVAPLVDDAGREDVRVITFGYESERNLGLEWPLDTDFYTELVYQMGDLEVGAIFLDLFFISDSLDYENLSEAITSVTGLPRPSLATDADKACFDGPLARLKCIIERDGIPVIIGLPPEKQGAETTRVLSEVAILADLHIGVDGQYNLYHHEQPADEGTQVIASPAALLFAAQCLRHASQQSNCLDNPVMTPLRKPVEPLRLAWSSRRHENRDIDVQRGCTSFPNALVKSVNLVLSQTMLGLPGIEEALVNERCLSHADYPYYILVQNDLDQYVDDLAGKLVLFGMTFQGFADTVNSPVFGRTPGVFAHATATDNLLSYGSKYIRYQTSGIWIDIVEISLMTSFLMFAFTVHAANVRGSSKTGGGTQGRLKRSWQVTLKSAAYLGLVGYLVATIWTAVLLYKTVDLRGYTLLPILLFLAGFWITATLVYYHRKVGRDDVNDMLVAVGLLILYALAVFSVAAGIAIVFGIYQLNFLGVVAAGIGFFFTFRLSVTKLRVDEK